MLFVNKGFLVIEFQPTRGENSEVRGSSTARITSYERLTNVQCVITRADAYTTVKLYARGGDQVRKWF